MDELINELNEQKNKLENMPPPVVQQIIQMGNGEFDKSKLTNELEQTIDIKI